MKTYKKPNNKAIYRQYDSRWGNLAYPVLPSTMAKSGCGDCAITHCIIERPKYARYTPKSIIEFMKKYAVKGHGTKHIGMPDGLKHYGFEYVMEHDTMPKLFKELEKGDRVGVLLFGSNRAPDGTLWTSAGHFVAFVGYRTSADGKKHYLYTKDSGGRLNDGWHCYETSMKGCVRKVWSAKLPKVEITLPKRGYFTKGDTGTNVNAIQEFLYNRGYYSGYITGKYDADTMKAVVAFEKKYGLKVDKGEWGKECEAQFKKLNK